MDFMGIKKGGKYIISVQLSGWNNFLNFSISFEENKAYMLNLKRQTEEAMAAGEIDKKDGLKILSDISVKLNDRFSVKDENQDQIVIVNSKYDAVCSRCGAEVSRRPITKDEAMEMYNLVEKE